MIRVPNGMRTLLSQLGINVDAATTPNLGTESDTASATGSAFAQINKAQVDIGASTDTASASGSLFARAKFNKDAADALAIRATALEAATKDVQTITLDTVVPTDAVIVSGTTFTAVASGATGNEFNLGASDTEAATALAAKIAALSGVSATSDGAVVTVTADAVGVGIAITSADTTMVVASLTAANVMGLIHGLLSEIASLDARVTAVEGT